jgi:stage V sporulation protein D (sporulation-specific penicillin-binding protein)
VEKTDTTQKAKNGKYLVNNYIVSFIGFAPEDDPQIVVYVGVNLVEWFLPTL